MEQNLWLIQMRLCLRVITAPNSWRRYDHGNIFLLETATQMLQKDCPPQPTHRGCVVSPDKVISSEEKHCWLCTLTSLSSWHLWAPNMSTGCFQEGMGPCRQMGRGSDVLEKWDVFQGLSNWAWILIQECQNSSLVWMPAQEIKGIPFCFQLQCRMWGIRHLAFIWCLYDQSTLLTLHN